MDASGIVAGAGPAGLMLDRRGLLNRFGDIGTSDAGHFGSW